MVPAPTTSPSIRSAAPKPPISGPSWIRRTSLTEPRFRPSESTTLLRSSSLISILPAAWDVADDVVPRPSLECERGDFLAVEAQGHVIADVGHSRDRDPERIGTFGGEGEARETSQP